MPERAQKCENYSIFIQKCPIPLKWPILIVSAEQWEI